jgi:hypothetical protein
LSAPSLRVFKLSSLAVLCSRAIDSSGDEIARLNGSRLQIVVRTIPGSGAVRFLYTITSVVRALLEPERIIRCARIGATVLATTVAVLLASFVAIAMGLI